jgi:hypothetical protein
MIAAAVILDPIEVRTFKNGLTGLTLATSAT